MNGGKKKKWVHVAPLPCSYRGQYTTEEYSNDGEIGELYADEVLKLIKQANNADRTIAAFISESMISCGGQVILPKDYLKHTYK